MMRQRRRQRRSIVAFPLTNETDNIIINQYITECTRIAAPTFDGHGDRLVTQLPGPGRGVESGLAGLAAATWYYLL